MYLDETDQGLLAALKQNSRKSVTALAGDLEVSRVTVQVRLDRLIERGVIRRFTIETDETDQRDVVRAVMFIALKGAMSRRVIHVINNIPAITDLHSTNGAWDLVANVEASTLRDFDQVLRQVREIDGVTNSETCLLLDRARV